MAKQLSRATPPTTPHSWVEQDADWHTQLALRQTPGEPYEGHPACACAGAWRYRLAEHARYSSCRCLHRGGVLIEADRRTAAGPPA